MAQYLSLGTGALLFIALYTAIHKKGLNLHEILIPHLRHPSINDEIRAILDHPLFWLASIGIFATFGATMMMGVNSLEWFAFAVSLSIFLAVLDSMLVWFAEGKFREPLRFVIGSMVYGGLAGMAAFFFNTIFNLILSEITAYNTGIIVLAIAPIIEETFKMMGVYIYSTEKRFRGSIDGIITGFSVGVGFSVLENLFYVASKIETYDMNLLAYRVIYNTLAHGAFTAIGGAVLGRIKTDFHKISLKLLAIPIFIAVLIHSAFNILAVIDVIYSHHTLMDYYVFTPLLDGALLVILGYLIYKGRKEINKNTLS